MKTGIEDLHGKILLYVGSALTGLVAAFAVAHLDRENDAKTADREKTWQRLPFEGITCKNLKIEPTENGVNVVVPTYCGPKNPSS